MYRSITALAAALSLAVVAAPSPASAHPENARLTENRLAFSYDAEDGSLKSSTTTKMSSSEDVVFRARVVESEDGASGLIGKLKLRLEGDEEVVMEGWFAFKITGADGNVAFRQSLPRTIHLYPEPGQRRATLRFRIDLPTGDYTARGSYAS